MATTACDYYRPFLDTGAIMVRRGRKGLNGIILLALLPMLLGVASVAEARMDRPYHEDDGLKGPRRTAEYIDQENRTVDVGLLWMTITNFGYFGNDSPTRTSALTDPCTGEWAVQAEYPGGSGTQYLYRGGLWVGAMIQEEDFDYPRVSVGTEGWEGDEEFHPASRLEERSIRLNAFNCLGEFITNEFAVSEQDFVTSYADTTTVLPGGAVIGYPKDGPHIPLGIKVTQSTYAWSYNYAQDFIIIDYEIENIADKFLKNLYIGLFVDADVGRTDSDGNHYQDDICGFTKTYKYLPPGSVSGDSLELTINTAWIADNDGRPQNVSSGASFTCPDITGSRIVRAPNPKLRTSFNWWISNGDDPVNLDFGPSWDDDESNWTDRLGTPVTDADKYEVLSNREFDYDQIYVDDPGYIADNPQIFRDRFDPDVILEEHAWKQPAVSNAGDLADGYDTRYLISWGPLGIYDFTDESGNQIYRLNPGESFSMTMAYVAGANFHDRNNPQVSNTNIDPEKFNFADFQYNADWAAKVYDNPMVDTYMQPGSWKALSEDDGGVQDDWFGEDVGTDRVYLPLERIGEEVTFWNPADDVWETLTYNGPDEDGSEMDGRLQPEEDTAPRPPLFDYTFGNNLFDQGDGVPDFQGPPPPPTPDLTYRTEGRDMILQWSSFPSEDPEYEDAFSRQQDFEGYRVYVSNSGQETEFSFLAEFDNIDYTYYTDNDSLLDSVYYQDEIDAAGWIPWVTHKEFGDIVGTLRPVGLNMGLESNNQLSSWMEDGARQYEYRINNTNPMIPRYYAVTAYDYGDYRSGTEPLESAKSANATYAAPAGNPRKKPGVVPNPYRTDADYTRQYLPLTYSEGDTTYVSWENRNDGTTGYFPQTDRRIYFYNLPEKCLVRIFTVSGDVVDIIE
ncbi:MAG TPA: hypothetical protein ENH10_02805, partial [Bacteroidetes bacterium]|nr:hypothetical protein [Bacteroidota bacterium]HEX04070.1 hypothetical protein [Bacteroidota bacterium]